MTSKAWPYEEARKLLKRWSDGKPDGAPVIFETDSSNWRRTVLSVLT